MNKDYFPKIKRVSHDLTRAKLSGSNRFLSNYWEGIERLNREDNKKGEKK
jgi:hypothetical protein